MIRVLPVCAALVALVLFDRSTAAQEQPTETVIRLTVQPAAEPKLARRYQLLPELAEMEPGNPIQEYLKCFMEQTPFFHNKEVIEQREKWNEMPLKDLPVKELRHYGGVALTRADDAARRETPDWQTLIPLRRDGFGLLVPEVQQLRGLIWALRVRLRGEIADKRFDDGITTAKTLFAMSRHLNEHPSLVGNLVGVLAAATALDVLDEMIGQPGSPNLYWGLTDLPSPLIDLRKGLQGVRVALASHFREVDERAPMTETQMQQVVERTQSMYRTFNYKEKPRLAERAKDAAGVAAARKRLVEHGLPAETLNRFPALQTILLDEKMSNEARHDAAAKVMPLPYWQAEPLLAKQPAPGPEAGDLPYTVSPKAYLSVRRAQARVDQRIALLRCVEGLRLYAAAHDGKLPAKLADVPVPLPVDPMSGRPFVYLLEGGTATVRGTPPAGMEKSAPYNVRYEIKIAK